MDKMKIQDVSISHNQKKKIAKVITDQDVLIEDEGDLVLNVIAYKTLKEKTDKSPVEDIVGDNLLDLNVDYIVFM